MKWLAILILVFLLTLATSYDSTLLSACSASCTAGCRTCNSSVCVACQLGYTLDSGANTCNYNTCTNPDCYACSSNGSCLQCNDPYSVFNSTTSSCQLTCPLSNCAKCYTGSTTCLECNSGYSVYSLTNQCIPTLISKCLKLHDFRYQQFQCTLCMTGYKPSLDQTQCISDACTTIGDCKACAVSTVCDKCRAGYSFNNGKCLPNSCSVENCLYCDNSGTCLRCKSNYTLNGNRCDQRSCPLTNCQNCKQNSIYCDNCGSGYNINIWTKTCEGNPKLKYLWFLLLLLIPIIIIVVVCIVKRRAKISELNNKSFDSKLEDTKVVTKDVLDMSSGQVSSFQHLPSSSTRLEPIKPKDANEVKAS